jgi:hypothetical protein
MVTVQRVNTLGALTLPICACRARPHPTRRSVSRCSLKESEAIDIEFSGVTGVDVDVVLYVMYVTPDGKPLAEKDLSKCDKLND